MLATPEARAKLLRFFIGLARGQGARRVRDRDQRVPRVHAGGGGGRGRRRRERSWSASSRARRRARRTSPSRPSRSSRGDRVPLRRRARRRRRSVDLDPAQRLGIFTQPAVIASHSGPTTTRLVKRGVFFTRKVMCLPLGAPPDDVDTTIPTTAGATERQRIETVTAPAKCAGLPRLHQPVRLHAGELRRHRPLAHAPTRASRSTPSISVDFLDEGPLTHELAGRGAARLHALAALPAVLRAPAVPLLHGPRRGARATTRCCGRCSSTSPTTTSRTSSACCARWRARRSSRSARRHHEDEAQAHPPRPDQALRRRWRSCSRRWRARWATSPAARSSGAPRFVMFFKGGSFHSPPISPTRDRRPRRHAARAARAARAGPHPVSGHEHPRRLAQDRRLPGRARRGPDRLRRPATATTTPRTTRTTRTPTTSRSTSRSPTTTRPSRARGAAVRQPAHRRRRALRRRQRRASASATSRTASASRATAQYGNAIEPIQDAGQVYDTLMQRVNLICAKDSRTSPAPTTPSSAPRSSARRA